MPPCGVRTWVAPAEDLLKLVLGAESVEACDQKAGVRHVTVGGQRHGGRRRAGSNAVDDPLWQRAATVCVRRRQRAGRNDRRRTLQLETSQAVKAPWIRQCFRPFCWNGTLWGVQIVRVTPCSDATVCHIPDGQIHYFFILSYAQNTEEHRCMPVTL